MTASELVHTHRITLLEHRCNLLKRMNEFKVNYRFNQDELYILQECCRILIQDLEFCLLWIGKRAQEDEDTLIPLVAVSNSCDEADCLRDITQVLAEKEYRPPALRAMAGGSPQIFGPEDLKQFPSPTLQRLAKDNNASSIGAWPLVSNGREYGVLTIYSTNPQAFQGAELDFISNILADISLTMYLDETAKRLDQQRDFNAEIIDTVQALLVSLMPCGNILSFNQKAQEITGYTEEEVKGKYWVDVLITPEKRQESQARFSDLLKAANSDMNFQTEILTKLGEKRIISWHGSIQSNIGKGQVGLVLFGQDITSTVSAERDRENALAKWNNIFNSMQDPALVVSEDGIILDANTSTCIAAKRERKDILDKGVCEILHGGRSPGAVCPLETLLKDKRNRTFETELKGLQGNYMMTVSPLKSYAGQSGVSLLLARDLTEEQLMKAEALRAAQLASVGELAAGVAHEINNPINGIINYAQILLDSLSEENSRHFLQCIIQEGKRIAGITRKLLDFSRKVEDAPEPIDIQRLVNNSIDLIQHQFSLDGIELVQNFPLGLPLIHCNPHQLQQVLLNIFSNARHAVNQKFADNPAGTKNIILEATTKQIDNREYVRLAITDNGSGIKHEIIDRVMDPFFSTKPHGQGTGLGLSISQSLVQENGGFLRLHSELGKYTSVQVDLPVSEHTGE